MRLPRWIVDGILPQKLTLINFFLGKGRGVRLTRVYLDFVAHGNT
jgi:hypothetical protein